MKTIVLFFLVAVFLCLDPARATLSTTQEIEESLTCQCSCGLTVHSCNHLQCGFAVPAKQTIAQQVQQGKGKDEIIAAFVARYGEKVLSAPTTTGFNLAAWITPFLALLIGGAFVGMLSLRWTRKRSQGVTEMPVASTGINQYRERLQKELDIFDR